MNWCLNEDLKNNGFTIGIILAIIVLLGCQDTGNLSPARNSNLPNPSIYANFQMGEHEWYLENPWDSVKLYIFEYGTGEDTIIVLHGGFGAEHRYLKDAFEGLYDRYHFVFYDQRGSLRSPCPADKISIDKHISDLEAIRIELGLNQLNLFGHSNGTTLANFYLKKYPDKVKGFIMTACMQMEQPLPPELKAVEQETYERFGTFINRSEVEQEIEKVNNNPTLPPAKKKFQIERIQHAKHYIYDISKWKRGKESYGPFFNYPAGNAVIRSMQASNPSGDYSHVELYKNQPFPITVIMGAYDMIDPEGTKFTYWAEQIPNLNYTLLDKAAHDAWIDQPEAFKEAFIAGMNRLNN